jgi:OOP family OmpA-OmpF porin
VLHGFSDGRGNPNYNMELSRKRAQAVAQYLITSYGIHQSRISVVGHGSTQSVLQPSGAVPDRMGRRVEFEVTR